jgi:phage gp36-like protein
MKYTTQLRIQTAIPLQHLNDALDDNGDGSMDNGLLDELIESASQAVDAFLSARYPVPFSIGPGLPPICAEASFIFACERIYDRRQILEKNPYRDQADAWRQHLAKIASGELNLDNTINTATGHGASVLDTIAVNGTMR